MPRNSAQSAAHLGEYESVPMINSYSHQSSDSSNSYNSNETGYSISPSLIMGSPGAFENSAFSSNYYDQSHNSDLSFETTSSSNASGYYYPQESYSEQNQIVRPANVRPTPTSLMWEGNWEIGNYYDLELPPKESKLKEPYLILLKDFPESAYTPRTVYLDREPNPQKGRHPCQFPGKACWEKKGSRPVFTRWADLIRHYTRLHVREKESIPCDYQNCTRAKDPFGRKDHYRDHLRDFHKEDMSRPSVSKKGADKETWRRERRVNERWWRCSKCLKRISVSKNGWKCSTCKVECDDERRVARTKGLEGIEEAKHEDKMEVEAPTQPYPECRGCDGSGYVNHGSALPWWKECLYCTSSAVPSYESSSSYIPASVSLSSRNDRAGYEGDSQSSSWQ